MGEMQLNVWCGSDKGLRRESNQDSFLLNRELGLFIVADGMGGHSGGEVASSLAVKSVEDFFKKNQKSIRSPRELLTKSYAEASLTIFSEAAKDPGLAGMGTTMVLCYFDGHSMFIANAGDSRAYLYRKPYLWQMTEDHSLMNEQLRAGIINDEQARNFTSRNVITRSVGYEKEVAVDILERQAQSGDHFLLCSDGLSGLVPDVMITEILNRTPAERVTDICIERALSNGGDDNVTVLLVQLA
ncbi:MAG: serine/threonine-protein phosphatase [Bdellovibrio sp. CG10_big_fil_rev_8_21_14_0_10_47_8]|nr:MAG: serine/threonine-protein phosphatase [Bdellovibrio sp. CG10_big_fil_rev_8_21_14_0_10_47_8]